MGVILEINNVQMFGVQASAYFTEQFEVIKFFRAFSFGSNAVWYVAWSPDSKWLAAVSHSSNVKKSQLLWFVWLPI